MSTKPIIKIILLFGLMLFSRMTTAQCPDTLTGIFPSPLTSLNNLIFSLNSFEQTIAGAQAEEVSFNWTDEDGNPILSPQISFSYNQLGGSDGCAIDTQYVAFEAICLEDTNVVVLQDTIVILIHPNVILENTVFFPSYCETEITSVCEDIIIEYSIDGGNTYSLTPPALPGPDEPPFEMDYRIYWETIYSPNQYLVGTLLISCEPIEFNNFAPANAVWKFYFEGAFEVPDSRYEIFVEGDTLIQGKPCRIVTLENWGHTVSEIIYSENNQVYVYRDGIFHLVFDFDANVGDTIVVFEEPFTPFFHIPHENDSWDSLFVSYHEYFAYTITAIDSIERGGEWLTHQTVSSIGDWEFFNITELFGAVGPQGAGEHLFGKSKDIVYLDTYSYMYCYETPEIMLPVRENYDCLAQALGLEDLSQVQNEISAFPNPATNEVFFEFSNDSKPSQLVLYNAVGKAVKTFSIPQGTEQIRVNLSSLPSGIYFWQLGQESGKLIIE